MTNPGQPEWNDSTGGWNEPPRSDPGPQPGQPDPTQPWPQTAAYGQPTAAYGQPVPAYGQPAYGYPGYPPAPAGQPTNNLALVAMILSLVGFATCITAPVGAILGHVASRQLRERGEGGAGMAKTAIIIGWILTGLMVLVILGYVGLIIYAVNHPDDFDSASRY